ncbi:hypothetical protein COU96_03085 [Candidatus Shapirobacteria bacterium CG10_big_fil_rev_8_21_14_0_10_38_14]|uniref:Uncharacterized protein n=1 Tax=Candidatus Shapirobacteria bacterium CG10_big_fil_rev_8_21_14_0_10_38_14 TaxID=1974483 RepID=A0A2M8L4Y6_9BACT|nr:MAG: hypothetical protein COU96_03085 [Candidatus Shapirobacteria bacterium CG10_big_fil_rev_8_21_14_0_10_38_14]
MRLFHKNLLKQILGFPRLGKTASKASVRNRRCLKEGGRGKLYDRFYYIKTPPFLKGGVKSLKKSRDFVHY